MGLFPWGAEAPSDTPESSRSPTLSPHRHLCVMMGHHTRAFRAEGEADTSSLWAPQVSGPPGVP